MPPRAHLSIRTSLRVATGVALVLGLITTTVTPASAAPSASRFAAQATAAGLSPAQAKSLQSRVDAYLVSWGGKQVAANEIVAADGGASLVLTLPGQVTARRLGAVAAREPQGCPSGNMCAYKDVDLHGDFIWAYYCNGIYTVPWVTRGSWFNNQTGGVTAVFADNDWRRIGDTGPAPSRQWSGFDWRPVHGIDPC